MQQTAQHLLLPSEGNISRVEVLEGPTGRRLWPDEVSQGSDWAENCDLPKSTPYFSSELPQKE